MSIGLGAALSVREVVLLTVVGNRDPIDTTTGEEGPVLQYVDKAQLEPEWQRIAPNHAYLLHTSNNLFNAQEVARQLNTRGVIAHPLDLGTTDPTDFPVLLEQMGSHVFNVTNKHQTDLVTVLVSPGTGQISAVWLALGNERRLDAEFFQKKEFRYGGNIVPINFGPLFESGLIQTAQEVFRRGDFFSAQRQFTLLASQSYSKTRRDVAALLSGASEMLYEWDRFNYKDALAVYKNKVEPMYSSVHNLPPELTTFLQSQRQTLGRLGARSLREIIQDLVWSASRLHSSQRYMDCVWRCRTAYEVMLRETLIRSRVDYAGEGNVKEMERRIRGVGANLVVGGRTISVAGLHTPLSGMQAICDDQQLYDTLRQVATLRNSLVHEGRPCTKEEASLCFYATKEAVELFFEVAKEENDRYALSESSMVFLVQAADQALRMH